MDISTLLITGIAVCAALITYLSFLGNKSRTTIFFIVLVILIQIGLTIYKGVLDSELQNNLKNENVTINWKTGQVVTLNDNKPITNFSTTSSSIVTGSRVTDSSVAKIPDTTGTGGSRPHFDDPKFTEIPDKDLSRSECILTGNESSYFHGTYYLTSHLLEKVLLYKISGNNGDVDRNTLISPNETVLTPLVRTGRIDNKSDSVSGADEAVYYFRTVGPDPIKFGNISLTLHACKIRTQIITPNNLYLGKEVSHPAY